MGNVRGHDDQHFGPWRVQVSEAPTCDGESRRRGEGTVLGLNCWKGWNIRNNQASNFPGGRADAGPQVEENRG